MASLPQLRGVGAARSDPDSLPQKSPRSMILQGGSCPYDSPRAQVMALEDAQAAEVAVGQFFRALSGPKRQILLLRWESSEAFRGILYDSPDDMLARSGEVQALGRIFPRVREVFKTYAVGSEALVLILDKFSPCSEDGGVPFVGILRFPLSRAVRPREPPLTTDPQS